ncbi:MAG TPA: hypothetical protein VM846_02720 [Vicinamibacterales bacterium]|nr:hypothetical protein [Vicinamibacterales bacterium]
MGRTLVIAVMVTTLTAGAPVFVPDSGQADAQISGCSCFAVVDAIDSDLHFVARYYKTTNVTSVGSQCAQECDTWRQNWFYGDACDNPQRINRGTNASWGYASRQGDVFIGPATWWCPFPPP